MSHFNQHSHLRTFFSSAPSGTLRFQGDGDLHLLQNWAFTDVCIVQVCVCVLLKGVFVLILVHSATLFIYILYKHYFGIECFLVL